MDGNKARGVQFVADRILNRSGRRTRRRPRRSGADAGTAEQPRARRRHLHGAVLSRATAPTDAARRRPARPPGRRWRRRSPDRRASTAIATTSSRPVMHGLAGPVDGKTYPQVMVAMGIEQGSVDRGRRVVRAQQLRKHRHVRDHSPTSRRVRAATGDRKAPWTVDGAGGVAATRCSSPMRSWKVTASHDGRPAPQANAEGGYNYRRQRRRRADLPGLDDRACRSSRACGFRSSCPRRSLLTEIQFTSSTVGGRAGAPPVGRSRGAIGSRSRPMAATWSAPVAEGQGGPGTPSSRSRRSARQFVRITQTATVDDAPPWSMRLLRLYEAPR